MKLYIYENFNNQGIINRLISFGIPTIIFIIGYPLLWNNIIKLLPSYFNNLNTIELIIVIIFFNINFVFINHIIDYIKNKF